MSELSELQFWMADLLRRRRSLARSDAMTALAALHFTGNAHLTPVEQVNVYREQFWLRHTTALAEDFPGLGGVIGQADWERLVEDYLIDYPPTSFTLRDLGHRMAEHVERAAWLSHHELCCDMARLEWLYVEVFDAADAPPLDASKLRSLDEDALGRARIVLHPALRLLRASYPVVELRRRIRDQPDAHAAIPEREPQNLVLARDQARSLTSDVLSDGAFALLVALSEGVPLVAAAERAVQEHPAEERTVEASVGTWFEQWGRRGWLVDVEA